MKCIACGTRLNGNLDPELCMRCVNARTRWQDAASWLPLAKQRISDLEAELDEARKQLADTGRHAHTCDMWIHNPEGGSVLDESSVCTCGRSAWFVEYSRAVT